MCINPPCCVVLQHATKTETTQSPLYLLLITELLPAWTASRSPECFRCVILPQYLDILFSISRVLVFYTNPHLSQPQHGYHLSFGCFPSFRTDNRQSFWRACLGQTRLLSLTPFQGSLFFIHSSSSSYWHPNPRLSPAALPHLHHLPHQRFSQLLRTVPL